MDRRSREARPKAYAGVSGTPVWFGAYAFFKRLVDVVSFQFWRDQATINTYLRTSVDAFVAANTAYINANTPANATPAQQQAIKNQARKF